MVRTWGVVVTMAVATAATGCNRPSGRVAPGDGTLVLEVGGEQGSLRAALVQAGVDVGAGHRIADEAVAPSGPEHERAPEPGGAGDDEADPRRAVEPPPPAADVPTFVEVKLARGQTLIHLAKRHLGDGNRFPEILDCNGWDEHDARRLREGQTVKIPIDAKQPAEKVPAGRARDGASGEAGRR